MGDNDVNDDDNDILMYLVSWFLFDFLKRFLDKYVTVFFFPLTLWDGND